MSDEFLASAWRRPPPDFDRQLRERLRSVDARPAIGRKAGLRAACAAAVLAGLCLLSFPSVRAGAAAFLDLFRVVNFTAVPVQPEHIKALLSSGAAGGLDLKAMIGEAVQADQPPVPVQRADTPQQAAQLANIPLHLPAWLPAGMQVQQVGVLGEQRFTVTARVARLQSLLESQGINDLSIPEGIDGQVVRIDIPPVVEITYGSKAGPVKLLISHRPQASLPAGLDLARLAEIGLRVLGLDPSEAYRIAQSVDWRTTLLVPVPADATSFRQVDVQGQGGLLIQAAKASTPAGRHGPTALLLWSSGEEVFALAGLPGRNPVQGGDALLEMAQSMQ